MRAQTPAYLPPACGIPPRQAAPSTCSRRNLLTRLLPALPLVPLLLSSPSHARDIFGVGDAIPSERFEELRARVSGDVTLAQFVAMVDAGDVRAVWFFGPQNDYCCFQNAAGDFLHIGEGYPRESAKSPESPLHVIARVRDRNVPYYVAPVSGKYIRR